MWNFRFEPMADGCALKVKLDRDAAPVSYSEVLCAWQEDAEFRALFIALLADAPFAAFRWETPAITQATANRPFEFVLLDSPELLQPPDTSAFAKYFGKANASVVTFPNLGQDAILVVPCPLGSPTAYAHLAAFVRQAPLTQQHALWRMVGDVMQRRLSRKPVWLSTAGAGVAWLHVRLDDRPKYYGYRPYREPPRNEN